MWDPLKIVARDLTPLLGRHCIPQGVSVIVTLSGKLLRRLFLSISATIDSVVFDAFIPGSGRSHLQLLKMSSCMHGRCPNRISKYVILIIQVTFSQRNDFLSLIFFISRW